MIQTQRCKARNFGPTGTGTVGLPAPATHIWPIVGAYISRAQVQDIQFLQPRGINHQGLPASLQPFLGNQTPCARLEKGLILAFNYVPTWDGLGS